MSTCTIRVNIYGFQTRTCINVANMILKYFNYNTSIIIPPTTSNPIFHERDNIPKESSPSSGPPNHVFHFQTSISKATDPPKERQNSQTFSPYSHKSRARSQTMFFHSFELWLVILINIMWDDRIIFMRVVFALVKSFR